MKTYRALLIDPERYVIEVHDTNGSHEETLRLIRCGALDHFRLADHGSSWDYAWVDDGGLSRGEPIDAFVFLNRPDPVAGRCLLLGVDKQTGSVTDAKFPIVFLRDHCIEWLGKIVPEVTWEETDCTETGHTMRAGDAMVNTVTRAIVTYSRVKA